MLCGKGHAVPAVGVYTDGLGYRYGLCAWHLPGFVGLSDLLASRERKRRAGMLTPRDFGARGGRAGAGAAGDDGRP